MIQRIQSVYLVLGAVVLGALVFFGVVWEGAAATAQGWFTPVVVLFDGLAAAVAVGAVFLYKNRLRQRKVIVVAQGLTVMLLITFCGGLYLVDALYVRTSQGLDVGMLAALLLPIVAYVLLLLARRAVEKDIERVRSMDRLR